MKNGKNFTALDIFRLIAALLVIAIHTAPLSDISADGDFVLTRILGRIAVPFFFAASGFFAIQKCGGRNRFKNFLSKTALIYIASIILYIPLNIINGYFDKENLLPEIIRDIVFDGTYNHLWYLPASIIGALIAWILIKKLDYTKTFIITGLLYFVGLLGDTYFGAASLLTPINGFYELIFQIMDYTRNGLFYAPIFFVIGSYIADKKDKMKPVTAYIGFGISLIFMAAEALLLRFVAFPRIAFGDSEALSIMYVFLLPTVYFLISALVSHNKGNKIRGLRTATLLTYIIHPWVIVVLNKLGEMIKIKWLVMKNNHLVFYIFVCIVSVIVSWAAALIWEKITKKSSLQQGTDRAYIEINLDNLEHNVNVLKAALPEKSKLMAVVKTEAYGHGACEVAAFVEKCGIDAHAVATLDEGIKIRKYGIRGDILVLGYTDPRRIKDIKRYNLIQTVVNYDHAKALNDMKTHIRVHIKIDTGMHRLGVLSSEIDKIKEIFGMKYLKSEGIFSHLACSDSLSEASVSFTNEQISNFLKLKETLAEDGIKISKYHIQSSYGLLNYPELEMDYVRVGIALYGAADMSDEKARTKLDLKPVLSLKTSVALIRDIPAGESVSYDRMFMAERNSRVAILPIGYGDGLPRNLSCGKCRILLGGKLVPVIGRICMDQLAVDITDVADVKVGDVATVIGDEDNSLTAVNVASESQSIANELLCRIGVRLPVVSK